MYDIRQSIETLGVEPFANTLVQELGGGYFYVEANCGDECQSEDENYTFKQIDKKVVTGATYPDGEAKYDTKTEFWQYRIHSIPLRLAWFVIDALTLKASAANLGNHSYPEGRQRVYLPAGVEIFGRQINQITEIPAEMGPVVVEIL
uniref:Uncharacterized protein n=1 Tax=viral metagenome TaxID=1070528 RepID=A0A6M3KHG3_9ZZZZ